MKKRKLKKEVKLAIGVFMAILLIFVGVMISTSIYDEDMDSSNSQETTQENHIGEESSSGDIASIPNSINDSETLKYVQEFQKRAKKDSRYNEVIRNSAEYPKDILRLLYSNEETLDFVLSKSEMRVPNFFIKIDEECGDGVIPRLQQWDPKWGWFEYGNNVLAINGCGPTALSMVVSGLTGNDRITPIKIAKYSDRAGFHEVAGTNWNLMTEGAKKYGVKGWAVDNTKSSFESALKNGNPIICSVGPGYFTSEGHFIVIAGMKDGKLVIHDPNSISRSEKLWNYNDIKGQIKAAWAYSLK